jgi:RimJ/RimL family protein N-acetyltransferase
MISFSVITKDSKEKSVNTLFNSKNEQLAALEYLSEIDFIDGMEYAVSYFDGALLIRIYDGQRYVFNFPLPLSDGCDISSAVIELSQYVIKEEIPFYIYGVLREDFDFLNVFSNVEYEAMDDEGEYYLARIQNECDLLLEIPCETGERVTLNALSEGDIPALAALCKNEELLKYWGYDYREDFGEADDGFFYRRQLSEFYDGTAMTLAVRVSGALIGTLEFYAFDFCGACEFDVRILPEQQGLGYAKEAISLAISLARKMGLKKLSAHVFNENLKSVNMLNSLGFSLSCSDVKTKAFILDI